MHKVKAKGILSAANGMNIYRGCQHGCIYCDARSKCYQMNHRFEDIEVKENAPELLENALKRKRRKCMIGTGAMSDPYIPLEKELKLTRRCLEIINRYGFGVTVQTKSASVMRDEITWYDAYNSALQISGNDSIEVYHKSKLVPGVEIFPYRNILMPIIGEFMLNFGGTTKTLGTQPNRSVFKNKANTAAVAPVICYESIYGEYTTEYVREGANVLFTMTNDSWWGNSEGHKQLLSYARLRAIETRREIVRAANSGISAHINAKGDIVEDTFYGDQTALAVTANLLEEKSIYTKTGDLISRIAIFLH